MHHNKVTWVRSTKDPQRIHALDDKVPPHEPPRGRCGASPTEGETQDPGDRELTRCAACSLLLEAHAGRPPSDLREWIERDCAEREEELPSELRGLEVDGDAEAAHAARVLYGLVTGLTDQYIEIENALRAVRPLREHSQRARVISADLTETLVALEVAFGGVGHAESLLTLPDRKRSP